MVPPIVSVVDEAHQGPLETTLSPNHLVHLLVRRKMEHLHNSVVETPAGFILPYFDLFASKATGLDLY